MELSCERAWSIINIAHHILKEHCAFPEAFIGGTSIMVLDKKENEQTNLAQIKAVCREWENEMQHRTPSLQEEENLQNVFQKMRPGLSTSEKTFMDVHLQKRVRP